MGGREPDEKLARRPTGARVDRRAHLVGRQERDDRRQGYGQGHPQGELAELFPRLLVAKQRGVFYGFILLCQIKFVKKFFDWLKIIQKQKVRLK